MPSSTRLLPKKLFKFKDYQSMPWKNGQGMTSQIALQADPDQPEAAFLWRLGMATVSQDNSFSLFPGLQRLLVVWKGQGLWLNEYLLKPFLGFSFSGDWPVHCRLVGDEVIDLGLIYNPLKIKAQMSELVLDKKHHLINLEEGLYFLFAAENDFFIKDILVTEADTIQIEGPGEVELTWASDLQVRLLLFHLQNKG